jgi:hypothetical protein
MAERMRAAAAAAPAGHAIAADLLALAGRAAEPAPGGRSTSCDRSRVRRGVPDEVQRCRLAPRPGGTQRTDLQPPDELATGEPDVQAPSVARRCRTDPR